MSKCSDCKYCWDTQHNLGTCSLTRMVVDANAEHDCLYHNLDMIGVNICYNCEFYRGGGDWGMFCSHKDMYLHIGNFNDRPCEYFKYHETENTNDK